MSASLWSARFSEAVSSCSAVTSTASTLSAIRGRPGRRRGRCSLGTGAGPNVTRPERAGKALCGTPPAALLETSRPLSLEHAKWSGPGGNYGALTPPAHDPARLSAKGPTWRILSALPPCRSRLVSDSTHMRSSPSSAPAAWARSIARATRASGARWPSRCSRRRSPCDPERLQRFEQEARAAAALNHPNICAVYDIGAARAAHYIVSELLEGESLRERLEGGALPVRKADRVRRPAGAWPGGRAREEHRPSRPEARQRLRDG